MPNQFSFAWRLAVLLFAIPLATLCNAQAPTSVTVLPSVITAGSTASGMIALSAPTKAAENIAISSSTTGVTVPGSVSVPAGAQSASFKIFTEATLKTSTVTFTAKTAGASAVGFLLVQAQVVALPSMTEISFSPNILASGQKTTGTIAFTKGFPGAVVLDLKSLTAGVTVPTSVTLPSGQSLVTFAVTTTSEQATETARIEVSYAAGSYASAAPSSLIGTFTLLAGPNLPPNYLAGYWVSQPVTVTDSSSEQDFDVFTVVTDATGHLTFGEVDLDYIEGAFSQAYEDQYYGLALVNQAGLLNLLQGDDGIFPTYDYPAQGVKAAGYTFDGSKVVFSADGKTMTLTVIGVENSWSISKSPVVTFGSPVTLATYKFTRAR